MRAVAVAASAITLEARCMVVGQRDQRFGHLGSAMEAGVSTLTYSWRRLADSQSPGRLFEAVKTVVAAKPARRATSQVY